MDSRSFDRQFKDVRYSPYTLISIDAHGHGETTGRDEKFTFWDTASDSLQLLTKLGLDQFYVLGTTQGGYDPALNCLFNRDATDDKLDEINIPALVLHGADDRMFPAQDAKEWSSKLPKLWKFEIVERGVHQLSLTEPGDEVVAQLIPQFIKETL
ncbi:unnamed protein product [Rotaria sp. Silwood1]|nr:unnamed protein product [Rotaria sp. Silwood1]CAF5092058.1 unnamed protein product [Rotaria sp. Silwood1]